MDQFVVKRDGRQQPVKLEKVLNRIEQQCTVQSKIDTNYVKPLEVAKKVIDGIYNGVTTRELDQLAVETAATLATNHPDYDKLAARLAVSALHKETKKYFSEVTEDLYNYINPETNEQAPLVSKEYYDVVMANRDQLDGAISYNRDYDYDYIGFKTLEKSYLLKIDKKVAERPQHLIMRCAVGIHGNDIEEAIKTYDMMSQRLFTHATPTLFNAGMPRSQLASCFLLSSDDSIEGIFDSLKECAKISKNAGGIGLSVSDIRAHGSYITGTNGSSNGLIPFLKIFNETARAVDQCFVESTNIVTNNGLKKISELKIGDSVLTSDSTYKSIESVLVYDKKDVEMIKIKTSSGEIEVTESHLILVTRNNIEDIITDQELLRKQIISGKIVLEWIEASKLTSDMKIVKY